MSLSNTRWLWTCVWALGLCAVAQAAPNFPPLSGRVVDQAQVIDPQTTARLTAVLADFEQQSRTQLVVATIKDLQGYEIRDYGYQLGRAWGIGQKGQNNGVILLVAPAERAVDIEVGYGLEGQLTDALSRSIIEQHILPRFRSGDYPGGISAGVADIIAALGGKVPAGTAAPATAAGDGGEGGGSLPWLMILFIIVSVLSSSLRGHRGGFGGGGFGGGGFGGGGGGFGGGGGSFGGGGASGRW